MICENLKVKRPGAELSTERGRHGSLFGLLQQALRQNLKGKTSGLKFRNPLSEDTAANTVGSSEDRRKSRFDRNGICAADGSVVLCAVARL